MTKERAPLGFTDDLEPLDVSDFAPAKPKAANDRPRKTDTKKAASDAGFKSREPAADESRAGEATPKRAPRRHTTGRNRQLNMKARPETVDAFYRIADKQGWVLGETLEHAVALLEREYGSDRPGN